MKKEIKGLKVITDPVGIKYKVLNGNTIKVFNPIGKPYTAIFLFPTSLNKKSVRKWTL